jgi:acid stress-induced BolA-like protein IbaG/YrbA
MSSITNQIMSDIKAAIPDAEVVVDGAGGHFTIEVTSAEFVGKNIIQKQRLVYKAIWDLMKGDSAPVHAVDKMVCKTP